MNLLGILLLDGLMKVPQLLLQLLPQQALVVEAAEVVVTAVTPQPQVVALVVWFMDQQYQFQQPLIQLASVVVDQQTVFLEVPLLHSASPL